MIAMDNSLILTCEANAGHDNTMTDAVKIEALRVRADGGVCSNVRRVVSTAVSLHGLCDDAALRHLSAIREYLL